MPFRSRAQQGFMHAAAARGDIPERVVEKFDRATSARQYAHLPEHVRHDFRGALVERYFGGGEAGAHHHGSEHDERRGSYMEDGGHVACQHFAHGGVSASHDPECPHHPMYAGGGFVGLGRDDEYEDMDEPETEFERDEERAVGERPRGGELRNLALGGEAEDETQRLQGSEREAERNAPRSKFAEHLSGARIPRPTFARIRRGPATRVP